MTVHTTDEYGFEAPAPLNYPGRRNMPVGHSTGPEVGERVPNFVLRDQHGQLVDFHRDRGQSKAALVFFRSVVW